MTATRSRVTPLAHYPASACHRALVIIARRHGWQVEATSCGLRFTHPHAASLVVTGDTSRRRVCRRVARELRRREELWT